MKKDIYLLCLLFALILFGCNAGDNDNNGIELHLTTDTILDGTITTSSINVTGDGDTDFPDRFLTPVAFTAAIKSAKLIKEGDISPAYTIFDQGTISNPIVASISKGFTTKIAGNGAFPSPGAYNRLQLEISFLEMSIPNCLGSLFVFNCRLRYYLSSMDDLILKVNVAQRDILLEDDFLSPGQPYFNWINRGKGSNQPNPPLNPFNVVNTINPEIGRFIPAFPSPINFRSLITPLQVPTSQFPAPVTDPFVLTISLVSPLIISSDPSGIKVITMNFDLKGLLFFDDTNFNTAFDPWGTGCPTNCDGRLDSMSILGRPSADFYPGIPHISATVAD